MFKPQSSASTSPMLVRFRRLSRYGLLALATLLCYYWYFGVPTFRQSYTRTTVTFKSHAPLSHPPHNSKDALEFWNSFANALHKGKPSFEEIKRSSDHSPWIYYSREHQDSKRPDLVEVPDAQRDELRDLHQKAVDDMRLLAPGLPFTRGTRGIVTTANNDALAILTTSLWMLRSAGSTLPVEIWFYDYKSYEEVPCEDIFPSLNAKCLFMVDYLPEKIDHPFKIVKYTYKSLAMAFTTFEQFLFLDCDAFPIMNPDSLFDTEPFISTGMVLWPDYWADTASKHLFSILDKPVRDMTERATTEAGEMLVNKATHGRALLLATWYNTWGPEYWHRLVSQNAPGEGDKDIMRLAVEDYNLHWYQVSEKPQRLGYMCEDKKHPIGSGQSHPLDDYKIISNGYHRDANELSMGTTIHPRILFIHGNLPKYDPLVMFEWKLPELEWTDLIRCDGGDGEVHRLFGPAELTVPKFGWDVEKHLWNALIWSACVHEHDFKYWIEPSLLRPKLRTDLCIRWKELWSELFPGERWSRKVPTLSRSRPERPWGGVPWS